MAYWILALTLWAGHASATSHFIIGGQPTTIDKYPSMVQVAYQNPFSGTWGHSCAGNILTTRTILSAAHCFGGPNYAPQLRRIRAGSTYRDTGGQVNYVLIAVNHPLWEHGKYPNDISVVRLITPLVYTPVVAKAAIPPQGTLIPNDLPVVYAGWGVINHSHQLSKVLQDISVYTVDYDLCADIYLNKHQHAIKITKDMICAGIPGIADKNVCRADSGGPMYYNNITIGIVAFGHSCGNPDFPTVSMSVGSYTDWIVANTVVHQGGILSESPLWVNEEGVFYWVDTVAQKVFRMDIKTGEVTSVHIEYGPVSLLVKVKDYPKLFVISVRAELYFLDFDKFENDKSLKLITALDIGSPTNRVDDGKVDAKGRIWFGTMGLERNDQYQKDLGSVYMITENNYKNPEMKIRPISISNGIAWSADNKQMFYIDSGSQAVAVYDFDLQNGTIVNRRTLFSLPANNVTGFPDGMTIDTDDNLWVACYLGSKVIKIDSKTGKLLEQHEFPVTKVTSVMWGGSDYSTLYVTSASKDFTEAVLKQQPEAGSVFTLTGTGSSGVPMNEFIFKNADKY